LKTTLNLAQAASQRCLVVTATTLVITAIWAPPVPFGPLPGALVIAPGPVFCIVSVQISAGTTTVRGAGSLFVVLGIRLFDYLGFGA